MEENSVASQIDSANVEIGLLDICRFIGRHALELAIFIMIGMVTAYLAFNFLPKKWEADATLQIGKVPVLGRFESIESTGDVIERIHSPSFISKLLPKMYKEKLRSGAPDILQMLKDLKVTAIDGTNLVVIQDYSDNPEQAYKNVRIIADAVVSEHAETARQYLLTSVERLKEVEKELAKSYKALDDLQEIDRRSPSKSPDEALLKLSIMSVKNGDIQKLQAERAQLQNLLALSRQQATILVASSLVPQVPSSPRLKSLVLAGLLIGLFFGMVFSLAREFFVSSRFRHRVR